jgi:hypothetical protein
MPTKNTTEWNTIHIFSYGETQIIGKGINKKVSNDSLTKLQAVINHFYNKKPLDNNSTTDFHVINIFNDMFADYCPKEIKVKSFRTEYADLDSKIIGNLVKELEAIA